MGAASCFETLTSPCGQGELLSMRPIESLTILAPAILAPMRGAWRSNHPSAQVASAPLLESWPLSPSHGGRLGARPACLLEERKKVAAVTRRNCVASLRLGDGTMAYVLNQRHVDIALSSGRLLQHGKPVEFQRLEIGQLLVTSGALAASDPFVFPNPAPFTQAIPAGCYPVSIAIGSFETRGEHDERVVFARVALSNLPAVYWTMALWEGQ